MTKVQIKDIQQSLNHFTSKYLRGVNPIIVDGDKGPATNRRIMTVKFYLGYGQPRDGEITSKFVRRMRHPQSPKYALPQMLATAAARRVKQRTRFAEQQARAAIAPGVTTFDGVPCAKWVAAHLKHVRDAGQWEGRLTSGWRSPAHSREVCMQMCGAPSCPGRCAGASSNHSGSKAPAGAADVSDNVRFGQECQRLGIPLHNALPQDRIHFSTSGS